MTEGIRLFVSLMSLIHGFLLVLLVLDKEGWVIILLENSLADIILVDGSSIVFFFLL